MNRKKPEPPPPEPIVLKPETLTATATSMSLGAHECKWPIGDPNDDDFGFCGRPATGRYCEAHSSLGRTVSKTTTKELARSIRRYL